MLTGTQYLSQLATDKTWAQRSARALAAIRDGNVPTWLKTKPWPTIVSTAVIDGKMRRLTMRVSPDFVAVGTDEDYARAPMTPGDADQAALFYHARLPTRKIARLIWQQAGLRVPLTDVKGAPTKIPLSKIESPEAVAAARVIDRLHIPDHAAGEMLVDGERKTVVTGPHLDGTHVAIFGGQLGDGSGSYKGIDGKGKGTAFTASHPEDIALVQSYSTIHVASYVDDSHGIRFVFNTADLDGMPVLLDAIALDPKLAVLVSDQTGEGLFPLRFPSVVDGKPPPSKVLPMVPPGTKPPGTVPGGGGGTGTGSGGKPPVGGVAGGGGAGIAVAAVAAIAIGAMLLAGSR